MKNLSVLILSIFMSLGAIAGEPKPGEIEGNTAMEFIQSLRYTNIVPTQYNIMIDRGLLYQADSLRCEMSYNLSVGTTSPSFSIPSYFCQIQDFGQTTEFQGATAHALFRALEKFAEVDHAMGKSYVGVNGVHCIHSLRRPANERFECTYDD